MRLFTTMLLGLVAPVPVRAAEWPQVPDFDVVVGMDWNAEKIHLDVPLRDVEGAIQYRLICRGGKESYLDPLADELGINYVGPLMCILNEGDVEGELSLLRETAVAPWYTRGRFSNQDLIGACGASPEYGRVRNFRLRGFRLTLEVVDPEVVADGRIGFSIFRVAVRSDPEATSAIAAPTGYPDPRQKPGICAHD